MSQKVTPFMGGLGRDVTSKFEITDDASVTVGNGTTTGNLTIGGSTEMGSFTANGQAIFGNIQGTNLRNRFVYSAYNDQMYQQIGDGTAGSGGTFNFSRYLESNPEHIAMSINTITLSSSFTGNVDIGTNSSNTVAITGALDVNGTFDLGSF